MKIIILGMFLGSLTLMGCQATSSMKDVKTLELFNGKDLSNWTIESNGQFSVSDGVLKVNRGTGWLRSNDTFKDYVLTMEFRFLEKDANSGIFVRTKATNHQDEKGYPNNGYQIQAKDTLEGIALAQMIPYGAPPFENTFDLAALRKAYKPHGNWHTYNITAKGETLEIKLNGIVISTATNIENLEGHIGIQGEYGLLEFRKIEVIEL